MEQYQIYALDGFDTGVSPGSLGGCRFYLIIQFLVSSTSCDGIHLGL